MIDLSLEAGARGQWSAELVGRSTSVRAPHVIDLEVTSTLRRLTLLRVISARRARTALGDFLELPIRRYPSTQLLERVFELRNNLTAYDAAYVALAEALDAPLVTTDDRLARSRGHTAEILTPA